MSELKAEEPIRRFVIESNRIEGIEKTTQRHIDAHMAFLGGVVSIPALVTLVGQLRPNAKFRNKETISGVRVNNHIAPRSGPDIEKELRSILAMRDPWVQHIAYEALHPFTDGNGRSGRAIWLHRFYHEWEMDPRAIERGFLHSFYYHTLATVRLSEHISKDVRVIDESTVTDDMVERAMGAYNTAPIDTMAHVSVNQAVAMRTALAAATARKT